MIYVCCHNHCFFKDNSQYFRRSSDSSTPQSTKRRCSLDRTSVPLNPPSSSGVPRVLRKKQYEQVSCEEILFLSSNVVDVEDNKNLGNYINAFNIINFNCTNMFENLCRRGSMKFSLNACESFAFSILQISSVIWGRYERFKQTEAVYESKMKLREALFTIVKGVFPCKSGVKFILSIEATI